MPRPLTLHPDRLFPAEPSTRAVARALYDQVKDLPIISPHGHVPAAWIAEDTAFIDPTSLLITPDHYVTRLMHASGVDLASLGVGQGPLSPEASREAFRTFCRHWGHYAGTPVRYWMADQLVQIFGVDVEPSEETADQIYDAVAATITEPGFRPRALMERFDITFIATTDDPCDDLAHHAAIAADPAFSRTVAPTFRPDRYLEPARSSWNEDVDRLGQVSGVDTTTYHGWVEAMEVRRAHFTAHGAVSTDHSHRDLGTQRLDDAEASRLYRLARSGEIQPEQGDALRRHFVNEMARMATEDGLVMTLHPAVHRNHHTPSFDALGPDVGADIPISLEVTRAVQPMLEAYGTHPNFTLVLFTIDESTFSREIAPLAGFYPSVHVGVPWWFIDAPDAIKRFRKATTETAGFTRGSGFIDDTRAFLSIPARHDMARRIDCVHLADLVVEHRLDEDEAAGIARQLVVDLPRKVFKL